jgi:uncharacterized protein
MKILLLFLFCLPLNAEPWGKDADLATFKKPMIEKTVPPSSRLAELGIKAIRFHQIVISPADGPRSHFIPSSSQYTLDAMKKYGFFSGVMLGCDRLMRENSDPWIYRMTTDPAGHPMKWNPVP